MADVRPVVLVGFSSAWLAALSATEPAGSLIVVDDPAVVRRRELRAITAAEPAVREVIETPYHDDGAADALHVARPDLADAAAVLPVTDYGVPFAARLAERLGVPGAGYGAARLLRDKRLLRRVTAAAGVPNPRSVEVAGPGDVRAFLAEVDGPIVLKPANRQAALGTHIVRAEADVDAAWAAILDQDEGIVMPERPIPLRMLAERFVRGDEFSVEAMARGGEIVFAGATRKHLYPGPRPIERGHVHPADVAPEVTAALLDMTARVLRAVGVDTGFAHCEWIVEDGVPHLVECAGRLPGGWVMDIVELAWQHRVLAAYCGLMRGRDPGALPAAAAQSAAVWTAGAGVGVVERVTGVDVAVRLPGVHSCHASVEPGERTTELRSSWDRVVAAIAVGRSGADALGRARAAVDAVEVVVR